MQYATPSRLEVDTSAYLTCSMTKKLLKCLSKIKNGNCFTSYVFLEYTLGYTASDWAYIIENINLCGEGSDQDLAQIGCLYWKQLYLHNHCDITKSNDCQ